MHEIVIGSYLRESSCQIVGDFKFRGSRNAPFNFTEKRMKYNQIDLQILCYAFAGYVAMNQFVVMEGICLERFQESIGQVLAIVQITEYNIK